MNHMIVFTEIWAGCLFAAAAVVFRIRRERVREVRTKVGRHTHFNIPFRTK